MIKGFSLLAAMVSVLHAAETTDLGSLSRIVDSLGFMKPIPVTLTGFSSRWYKKERKIFQSRIQFFGVTFRF